MKYYISFIFAFFALFAFDASAQSTGKMRQAELESVPLSQIPLEGYDEVLPGDPAPVLEPSYRYKALVYGIRDADTIQAHVDVGFNIWLWVYIRYYGVDTFEITKSGGKKQSHVDRGYKCRDLMIEWLGSTETFPHKSQYHTFKEPIDIVVESVGADKYSGRWLFIPHKNGKNLSTLAARSGCGIVTTFQRDPVFFPRDTPITKNLK